MTKEQAKEVAAVPWDIFLSRWSTLAEKGKRDAALRLRYRYNRGDFLRHMFPQRYDLAWSPVHRTFLADETECWRDRTRQTMTLDIAPRGSAKTSMKSFGDLVHEIVYGLEVSILVFSTGFQLAEDIVKDLHQVFTGKGDGDRLAELYGPFTVTGTQTAFSVFCPHGEPLGTEVAAMSFGGTVRGHKYKGRRPSLFVLDDTVNPKHLKNPTMRDKSAKFLNSDILKAGFGYSRFRMVGTIQHDDDLVSRCAKSPGWRTRKWKNLIAWPTNTVRWEECRRLWADLDDMGRVETAHRFYLEHKEEMDAGADVLWPEGRGLFALMCAYWQYPVAFFAEDQNEPRDPNAAIFDLSRAKWCRLVSRTTLRNSRGEDIDLRRCDIGIWLDHAGGKKDSDYGAIAVVARHPAGWYYLLECELTKRAPSAQHAALWDAWARWSHLSRVTVGYDATGTQSLLEEAIERIREERRRHGLAWDMPSRAVSLVQGKDAIAGLDPYIGNGWLELTDAIPAEVREQIELYPGGLNDDGPDAIHKAMTLLGALPTVQRGLDSRDNVHSDDW